MITHQSKTNIEPELPPMDEGWWASVLSDEEIQEPDLGESENKTTLSSSALMVDWEKVQSVFDHDEILELFVQGFNRGGLLVQGDNIQGFVPLSHLIASSTDCDEDGKRMILSNYVGKTIKLKVIECEPAQERVVLSERAALAGEGSRKALFQTLKTGSIVNGIITNITDFGVFVDLGGVEGLIHVSELSWGRVQHPGEILSLGQPIKVLVLQVSEESARIALSLKRLFRNPWESLAEMYGTGDIVSATITAITRFGVFARLEEGIEGLIHISTIQQGNGQKDLDSLFKTGQVVTVKILHIDIERRRLGLGLLDE
ncbi:MAG: S1 RNA-binding domain-containing protein [Anaerolineaceae bacterium]|jgi:small subunit ribosomal protein S1|nr:S1 RNA-binding domain-containing protein [Anaerolineaceae bacterium]